MLMQSKQEGAALKLQNPFTVRVGQVFTGLGAGCGIGIGVGAPINLRAVPVLGNVAGDAIGAFRSFKPYVDTLGKKLGLKNIQAGVGCGVGIGHGFGIGITLKPGAVQQLKQLLEQAYFNATERLKSLSGSSAFEDSGSADESRAMSIQERISPDNVSPTGSTTVHSPGNIFQNTSMAATGTQHYQEPTTMQSFANILQNTSMAVSKTQSTQESNSSEANRLQTENRILLTLLNHQEQIDLLRKENAALKQALKEVESTPLESNSSSPDEADTKVQEGLCKRTKCFECRRRAWQGR